MYLYCHCLGCVGVAALCPRHAIVVHHVLSVIFAFVWRQVQFNKTRDNEEEEGKLREELKSIDQQIKKLRQSSKSSSKQGDEIQALADARR